MNPQRAEMMRQLYAALAMLTGSELRQLACAVEKARADKHRPGTQRKPKFREA